MGDKSSGVYGKSYESMYDGSMVGAGLNVFAVWNYIITKGRNGYIEVNPKLLAFTLGGIDCDPKEIEAALEFLQKPDPESRSKLEEGRRLVKEGQFMYRIVNWAEYNRLKNEEDRREYNRVKQAEFRQNRKRGLGLTEAQVLERLDKLKGRELAPGELSAELREIHGDMEIEERASGGAYTPVQLRRIARLKAKIAREEALEEAVKKSWNPDCAPRTESEKVKLPPGVTMCESIQKKVKEDPITIADQAAVAMKSGSALLNEPGEMTGLKSEELRDQESLP